MMSGLICISHPLNKQNPLHFTMLFTVVNMYVVVFECLSGADIIFSLILAMMTITI